MGFTALRSMKVELVDSKGKGTGRYEQRSPGAPVPEAAYWPNPGLWVKRGYIKVDDGTPFHQLPKGAPRPPRPVTKQDIQARVERREALEAGIPLPKTDFDKAGPHNIGPGKAADGTPLPAAVDETPADLDVTQPSMESAVIAADERKRLVSDDEKPSRDELLELAKKDLFKLLEQVGGEVKNPSRATKEDLVDAILAAPTPTE